MAAIALIVLWLSGAVFAQPARKQPQYCDGFPNWPIVGCLDAPAPWDMVIRSEDTVIGGWVFSLTTEQQPSDLRIAQTVKDAFGVASQVWLSRDDYIIQWRLPRPDVLRWARTVSGITKDALGYQVVIRAGVLAEGDNEIILQFTDPGGAVHWQQRTWLVLTP